MNNYNATATYSLCQNILTFANYFSGTKYSSYMPRWWTTNNIFWYCHWSTGLICLHPNPSQFHRPVWSNWQWIYAVPGEPNNRCTVLWSNLFHNVRRKKHSHINSQQIHELILYFQKISCMYVHIEISIFVFKYFPLNKGLKLNKTYNCAHVYNACNTINPIFYLRSACHELSD